MKRTYFIRYVFVVAACFAFFVTKMTSAQPLLIAHRGASFKAPENTLASATLAWELGADAVEVDVHLSADNRVMVIHDKNTRRTALGKNRYKIAKTNSEILRKVDVGSFKSDDFKSEKIPFIEELLEILPDGKTLVIEIKCGAEILPALQKAVDESGKINQIVFISFGWKTILETQKAFPNAPCYYLKMFSAGLSRKMNQAAEHGLKGVNLNYRIIKPRTMKRASNLGIDILAWTVDDPDEVKRLSNMGVKMITTNRPGWLRENIRK